MTLEAARAALEAGNIPKAGELITAELTREPDSPAALALFAQMMMNGGKNAVARLAAMRACEVAPGAAEPWITWAAAELALENPDAADTALGRALGLDPHNPVCTAILAHVALQRYDFAGAEEFATQSIAVRDHHQPRIARAFARLHKRDWGAGWDDYHHGLGYMQWRERQDYGRPEWGGEPGAVLVYGEQGLGDQLAYCSAFGPEVAQVSCHPKLKHLLARSLPCEVHGDQFIKQIDWQPRSDYAINMAGYMRFRRRRPEDFPGTPYLRPHPAKARQWRALLDDLGPRPKIGLAWTGGITGSHGWRARNVALRDLLPLFDLPADFVSLEYRPDEAEIAQFREETGHQVHSWPWANRTDDLDDVAALVAGLDAVVCVPTTAYHVAGALGVPAHVIVHDRPHFHEGTTDERSPYWPGVRFYRRPALGKEGCIHAIRDALNHA